MTRLLLHDGANFRRGHQVAEPVAAQHKRAIGIEWNPLQLDEILIVGLVIFRPHIAKYFIAPRMPHGVGLAQLAAVFTLADGRLVVRDLLNGSVPDLIQPRIPHMTHHGAAILQHRHGEHARHALPFRIAARRAQNLIVGHGDGLANALFGGPGLSFQARAHAVYRDRGGLFARGLSANAVHHQEDAALRVDVECVFVVAAHPARVAGPRVPDLGLNHSTCFGTPGIRHPPGRCAPATAPAPPG